jgi:teneurin
LLISGTGVHLVHDSSDTPGYQSALFIALTLDSVPETLTVVRVRVVVEGVVFERDFEADSRLQYRFAWDRRNAYNQKVYGVATATGFILSHFFESSPKFESKVLNRCASCIDV